MFFYELISKIVFKKLNTGTDVLEFLINIAEAVRPRVSNVEGYQ
jgi:hypothetical protein